MKVVFASKRLEKLYTQGKGARKYPAQVVDAFLRAVSVIQEVSNETELYALKGLRLEKLSGDRRGQYSIRLNQQFRLVYRIEGNEEGNVVVLLEIVDYH